MAAILAKVSVTQPLGILIQALINMAVRAEYLGDNNSNPCSCLIEDGMRIGGVEAWVKKIVNNSGGEYRLNGAGLKMYVTINHTGMRAMVNFGGDQAHMYPEFVQEAKICAMKMGLDDGSYYKEVIAA